MCLGVQRCSSVSLGCKAIIGVPSYHFKEIADMNCYSLDIFFFFFYPGHSLQTLEMVMRESTSGQRFGKYSDQPVSEIPLLGDIC